MHKPIAFHIVEDVGLKIKEKTKLNQEKFEAPYPPKQGPCYFTLKVVDST